MQVTTKIAIWGYWVYFFPVSPNSFCFRSSPKPSSHWSPEDQYEKLSSNTSLPPLAASSQYMLSRFDTISWCYPARSPILFCINIRIVSSFLFSGSKEINFCGMASLVIKLIFTLVILLGFLLDFNGIFGADRESRWWIVGTDPLWDVRLRLTLECRGRRGESMMSSINIYACCD